MNGGLIIRLIDVVLIILFGFLAISDIQMKRQIRLPGPSPEQTPPREENDAYLFVNIDPENYFRVTLDGETLLETADLKSLRQKLLEVAATEARSLVVVINPEPDAAIQAVIRVFDICEQEGLAKSINMQPEPLSQAPGN